MPQQKRRKREALSTIGKARALYKKKKSHNFNTIETHKKKINKKLIVIFAVWPEICTFSELRALIVGSSHTYFKHHAFQKGQLWKLWKDMEWTVTVSTNALQEMTFQWQMPIQIVYNQYIFMYVHKAVMNSVSNNYSYK